MSIRFVKNGNFLHLSCVLQVLAYAQQSRESFNNEQLSLSERMQEYKRQIDHGSGQYLNGSHISRSVNCTQPLTRQSHKEIEVAMQSATEGKVFLLHGIHIFTFRPIIYYF